MQSNQGQGVPNAGGNDGDEEVWRDLVARLQEPDDAFMDEPGDAPDENSPTDGGDDGGPAAAGAGTARPAESSKGVGDFDPLGVWRRQSGPAPEEPVPGRPADAVAGDSGPRDFDVDDPGEEFVPEEPPSLAGSDPAIVVSWIGAAGGPIFLVIASIFWRNIPLLAVMGVIAAFLAGTGYLIYRLPKNRDHDSGDGAVV